MEHDKVAGNYLGRQGERGTLKTAPRQEEGSHSTRVPPSSVQKVHYVNLSEASMVGKKKNQLSSRQRESLKRKIRKSQGTNCRRNSQACGNQKTIKRQSFFLDFRYLFSSCFPSLPQSLPLSVSAFLPFSLPLSTSSSLTSLPSVLFCFHLFQYGNHP